MKKTYRVYYEGQLIERHCPESQIRLCKWLHDPAIRVVANQVDPENIGDGWDGMQDSAFSAVFVAVAGGLALLGFVVGAIMALV